MSGGNAIFKQVSDAPGFWCEYIQDHSFMLVGDELLKVAFAAGRFKILNLFPFQFPFQSTTPVNLVDKLPSVYR